MDQAQVLAQDLAWEDHLRHRLITITKVHLVTIMEEDLHLHPEVGEDMTTEIVGDMMTDVEVTVADTTTGDMTTAETFEGEEIAAVVQDLP